jgi:hypothetical protein
MTDEEAQAIRRENEYLKLRNAQLTADLVDLTAETARMRQAIERTGARQSGRPAPNPLGGGQ